jgi:hypothetical protein
LDLAVLSEFDINQGRNSSTFSILLSSDGSVLLYFALRGKDSDMSSREEGEETAERDIHLNLDLESNAGE